MRRAALGLLALALGACGAQSPAAGPDPAEDPRPAAPPFASPPPPDAAAARRDAAAPDLAAPEPDAARADQAPHQARPADARDAALSSDTAAARDASATPDAAAVLAFLDPTRLHRVDLTLAAADWQALRANYKADTYYRADVAIDGEVVRGIGIRSRGLGSRSSSKPGLKLDFNQYTPAQEFHGYKDLVLDNMTQDPTLLKEQLVFAVFEAMGIAAPARAYARLSVNGQYWGLYGLIEPVSKPFLGRRLGDKSGTLYDFDCKSSVCYNLTDLGDDPARYVPVPFDPQTNEDRPDHRRLVGFIRAANRPSSPTYLADVSAYLEVEHFLRYVAVENAVADGDGWLGDWYMNNFYLYEHGRTGRFWVLPWDKDYTFRAAQWPVLRRVDTNVLTRRLTALPAQRKIYLDALRQAVTQFVNARWLGPRLEAAHALIRNAALEDTRKPTSNADFENAVASLRRTIAARERDVLDQLAAMGP